MNKAIKMFGTLVVIFFIAFFSCGCDDKKGLETSLGKNEVSIASGEVIEVGVIGQDGKEVTWKTEDAKIATVEDGTIIGVSEGTTYIVVKSGGLQARIKVTVTKKVADGYTVTWKNHDGTVLETDNNVPSGTTPTYDGATPIKEATAEYTYQFSGWSPEVGAITGNTTYTAQFTKMAIKYTVTWKNHDGTVLETDTNVAYGTTPKYDGATPTKEATAEYTYQFSGWSPTLATVTSDVTYTAQFSETVNKYTVTWKNYDGTVLKTNTNIPYGTTPTYDGTTPTKPATVEYTYTHSGWSPAVVAITGNVTYTAQFTETLKKYTVTWKNYDGTVLETDTNVAHGTTPKYDGATPTKEATAEHTYQFSGWSPTLVTVTSDVTYTAQFSETVNKYTVTWKNYDGTVLEIDTNVLYGSTPTYDGATPTKPATPQFTYTFSGWTPNLNTVTGNVEYTATFESIVINTDDFIFVDKGDGYTVVKYLGNASNVVIPELYNGKSVVSIEQWAFAGNQTMVSVTIPNSVSHIKEDAFAECILLKTVNFGSGLKSVELHAFNGCKALETINFPEGLTHLGDMLFMDCEALKSVSLPNSIEDFGFEMFFGADAVVLNEYENGKYLGNATNPYLVFIGMIDDTQTTITFHNNCKVIANSALENKNITTINFGSGVKTIGKSAFNNCSALTELVIPNSVTKIDESAFQRSSITSVTLGSNVKYLGFGAFMECSKLVTVLIPNGIEYIGNYAFDYCNLLAQTQYGNAYYLGNSENPYLYLQKAVSKTISAVAIHQNTKIIGSYAFSGCSNLTTVTIPKDVKVIGEAIFYGCRNLTEVIVSAENTVYEAPNKTAVIEKATKTLVLGLKNAIIPNGVLHIGDCAFYGCSELVSIVIPEGVLTIGDYAFGYYLKLESIVIPNSVTKIGEYAFGNCSKLTSVTLSNNLVAIPSSAFNCCELLTSITIPNSVSYIGEYAFSDCKALTSLTLGNDLVFIDTSAFQRCSALTSIKIPNNVKMIGNSAFYDCKAATSIEIGSGVIIIDEYAFIGCDQITTCIIDNGNKVYDSRDNANAIIETASNTLVTGFKSTVIPNSVTTIGEFAFYSSKTIENIVLGDNITTIGSFSFTHSSLKTITLGNGITSIGEYAFGSCLELNSIVIPNTVTNIGNSAFSHSVNLKIYAEATQQPTTWAEEWNSSSLPVYWYSETPNTDGAHWHYVDGVPTVWLP